MPFRYSSNTRGHKDKMHFLLWSLENDSKCVLQSPCYDDRTQLSLEPSRLTARNED